MFFNLWKYPFPYKFWNLSFMICETFLNFSYNSRNLFINEENFSYLWYLINFSNICFLSSIFF
jgi:hypothetical protein